MLKLKSCKCVRKYIIMKLLNPIEISQKDIATHKTIQ